MRDQHLKLRTDEHDLVGQWVSSSGETRADDVSSRIDRLTSEVLEPLAESTDGWDRLYRDPADARLWECTYPQSHLHGGGPPRLTVIGESEAKAKYGSHPGRGSTVDGLRGDAPVFMSAEDATAYLHGTEFPERAFQLFIANGITLAGSSDETGAAMALILDVVLAKGFEPDGYEQKAPYRVYRYKRFS